MKVNELIQRLLEQDPDGEMEVTVVNRGDYSIVDVEKISNKEGVHIEIPIEMRW